MYTAKGLLLFLSLIVDPALSRNIDYCYAENDQPYLKFATKTAYHFVHGGRTPHEPIPHCKPVQIWMLIRHGTRYPEPEKIVRMKDIGNLRDAIIDNHEAEGNGHLCDADLDNLRMWRLDPGVMPDTQQQLTKQGIEDMYLLGKRTKSNYPELFPPVITDVSSANYKFRSVKLDRMTDSKMAFMAGLFDKVVIPDAETPMNDNLFKSYAQCPRWGTEVANNPEVLKEVTKFSEGPEYQNLISNISRRLGFLKNITTDLIHDMWDMCRFDKAWNVNKLSPWCAVFSEEELKVLEYEATLGYYYKFGHGHEFNRRLGCQPMQHLFKHFQKLEGSDYSNEPKGIFSVAGSANLHFFMTSMGLAKDPTPLLASGFQSMSERQWRTSEIASFGSNIAAVFYKCTGTGSPNKVMFHISEKPVPYEGCTAGLCDWEYLKNKFPNATSDCHSDFCHPDSSVTQPTTIT